MLAERLLSTAVSMAQKSYFTKDPKPVMSLPAPAAGKEYLLYAHVPFCERLCPYCSFNRFPFNDERARSYFKSLRAQMRMVADLGYDFGSLYIGGGTPTILIDELCETIDLARELFSIKEVSTETNPNHLIPSVLEPLKDRVQRFSVGVQSFDDDLLKQMDRYDKYGSGAQILERLQSLEGFFHSLNVDMIFNFPSQSEEVLRADIAAVKASKCNQTTFYPLMASRSVERSLRNTVGMVDYDREARYYKILVDELSDTFELSTAWTFSRTGGGMIDEYIVDYEEYVGIGSGAFSYLDGNIYVTTFSLRDYDKAIGEGRMPVAIGSANNSLANQMRYRFLMELFGLRLDKRKFERDFGVSVERGLRKEMLFFRTFGGFATDNAEELTLTEKGRYLTVVMQRSMFADLNNLRDTARNALSADERDLLFGDGEPACGVDHTPPVL
ncbi:MAG: coproporphyrinogen III oxidase family protein [Coriobacteriia bacterium]|nr:coproporphyrinogen III oxidase family protein [Coriobacteriia bacterium]MBN2821678.1 coproporphyrinogen III oxidase family protein [Coriobacteriia bacterium]